MADPLDEFYAAVDKAKLVAPRGAKAPEPEKPLLYRRQGVLDGRNPHRRWKMRPESEYEAAHREIKKASLARALRRLDPSRPKRVRQAFATRSQRQRWTRIEPAGPQHKVDMPGFHGTPKRIQGRHLRPTRTKGMGLPEPKGVSYATKPQTARQFGGKLYRSRIRGNYGDAETFMRRAREHMKRGASDGEASRRTQSEFRAMGYHGVRWGEREVVSFQRRRARIHKARRALSCAITKALELMHG